MLQLLRRDGSRISIHSFVQVLAVASSLREVKPTVRNLLWHAFTTTNPRHRCLRIVELINGRTCRSVLSGEVALLAGLLAEEGERAVDAVADLVWHDRQVLG